VLQGTHRRPIGTENFETNLNDRQQAILLGRLSPTPPLPILQLMHAVTHSVVNFQMLARPPGALVADVCCHRPAMSQLGVSEQGSCPQLCVAEVALDDALHQFRHEVLEDTSVWQKFSKVGALV
jgi:hypothetical protein